jgi:hypothetical protein
MGDMRTHFMGTVLLAAGASAWFGSVASAELMIPDSGTGDRIMLFNDFNGALIDANWITDAGGTFVFSTPREAKQIGNQIWVTDQVADAVHRFDLNRSFLGSLTAHPNGGVLDNLRGIGFDGTTAYVLNGPLGTTQDARRGVVKYDTAGNTTGFINIIQSPFDVEPFQGDLLISDSDTNDIRRFTTGGTFISNFANDVTFPQQVAVQTDGTVLSVSSIAAAGVEGIYQFNPDGTLKTFINTEPIEEMVPQGVHLLGDGNFLLATSAGVYKVVDLGGGNGSFTPIITGVGAQYINPVAIPEPGGFALLGAGVALIARRRRRAALRGQI